MKWLLSRKRLLRLKRPVRSGMGPVSELFCKLRTRSWSRRVSVLGAHAPPRSKFWRTRRSTLGPLQSTPCHAQKRRPRVRGEGAAVMRMEMEEKVKRAEVAKSGGEAQVYTLEQLMKGSAELLGRGCLGSTYKAVLDNPLMGLACN